MPTSEEITLNAIAAKDISHIKKLGIIAGGGHLPHKLLAACLKKNIEPFIVAFDGQTDPDLVKNHHHFWGNLGAAGQILKTLKNHEIHDLVLIGSIKRPTLKDLKPDLKTLKFFTRIGLKSLGDNGLLSALKSEIEHDGFKIHGIQTFVEDLLAPKGVIGRYKPKKVDEQDIQKGIEICQKIGSMDIGQAVVVQEGLVLGIEAIEGTDKLIERCAELKKKGSGGVLVKLCKPNQDRDLDLPTIGPETILNAAKANLSGVVIHAGQSLLLEPEKVAEIADSNKMFVFATTLQKTET